MKCQTGEQQPRQHIKKQRHYFANKGPSSQGYGFSSSRVWMWEFNYKESWVPKNWCFWTVVLEKTLESPMDCKEIQPVHPKGDQSWVFIGRNDVEAETPILWPPDAKSWLIWKDPGAGKDWGQVEKGTTEDEMVGLHHWLNGCGFGWTLVVGDRQGGLMCCGSWGCKELDMTEWLNWTELGVQAHYYGFYFPKDARSIEFSINFLVTKCWQLMKNTSEHFFWTKLTCLLLAHRCLMCIFVSPLSPQP